MASKEYFNPYRMSYGVFIPNYIMDAEDLSSTEKILYGLLVSYAGKNGICYPSHEELSNKMNLSVRHVGDAIRGLEKKDYIEAIRPTGKQRLMHFRNNYRFILKPEFAEYMDKDALIANIVDNNLR